jgi:uncharacterized delta-60 repeat protein
MKDLLIIILLLISLRLYSQSGIPDNTFNGDGTEIITINGNEENATAVAVQADKKVILAGYTSIIYQDVVAVRLNEDGTLDSSFSDDGVLQLSTGTGPIERFSAVAIAPNGDIVFSGGTGDFTSNTKYLVARCDSNGVWDQDFNGSGWVSTNLSTQADLAFTVALQLDGKIVVGGTSSNNNGSMGIVRYTSDGTLDTTFSGNGKTFIDYFDNSDQLRDLKIQADGKIIICGFTGSGVGISDIMVVRLKTNGEIDSTFANNGYFIYDNNNGVDYGWGLELTQEGKILVVCPTTDGTFRTLLLQLTKDGILDGDFGNNGKKTFQIQNGNLYGYSLKRQTDGKILIGGTADHPNSDFAIIRCEADGTIDSTFGTNGMTFTDFAFQDDIGTIIALAPDNKIVLCGYTYDIMFNVLMAVARYNNDVVTHNTLLISKADTPCILMPNITSSTFSLQFVVDHFSSVSITMKNLQNQIASNLFTGFQSEGIYKKEFWVPSDCPSGIYYIELGIGERIQLMKLFVVR